MGWTEQDIPDQSGRCAVITGGNGGLGEATGLALARAGARVVLACRDGGKGEAAASRIGSAAPGAEVRVESVDLASLQSVRDLAGRLAESEPGGIDLLINNAGVMAPPWRETVDGFELQMGTNHLGHFALAGLLMPLLQRRPGSRVVTVSSQAHRIETISFDDLHSRRSYGRWRAYGQSKLANLLFAFELQRRLERAGAGTASMASHPGYAATHLQTSGPAIGGDPLSRLNTLAARAGRRLIAQSAAEGARTSLRAATDPALPGGSFVAPSGALEMRGDPEPVRARRLAYNESVARRLWDVSEELTGIGYEAAPV